MIEKDMIKEFNDSSLKGLFESEFQPVLSVNTIDIEVQLETSQMFKDMSQVFSMEADRVMRFTTNENYQVSTQEFVGYLTTLLYLRVARVNGTKNSTTRMYYHDQRNYLVPAFASTLINSIGIATDSDYGFRFIPVINVKVDELLSPQVMIEISRKLSVLNKQGFICTETGIHPEIKGDLELMATFNLESDIRSYKKNHPIFGFYASFFKHTIVSDALEAKSLRIKYGAESDYKLYLQHIV